VWEENSSSAFVYLKLKIQKYKKKWMHTELHRNAKNQCLCVCIYVHTCIHALICITATFLFSPEKAVSSSRLQL